MGDRCYMQITCRREDQERFAALGFTAQNWENAGPNYPLVVMVDEEANYAHTGELPVDVPFHGFNGPGGNYGDGVVACDGHEYAEMETGHDSGFVVDWDETTRRPSKQSLQRIRRYIKVQRKVEQLFHALTKPTK